VLTLLGAGVAAFPTAAAAAGPAAGHDGGKAGPLTVIVAVIVLLGVVLSGLRTIAAASRVRRREEPSEHSR
jgi:hypothetical protein